MKGKKREGLSPSLSNGHLDILLRRKETTIASSSTFCTVSMHERKEGGRRRDGPDRRVPWDLRVPFSMSRKRRSLSLAPGHRSHSTPLCHLLRETPCKVTNDCREDSRRRVLNKDPRRLNYPHPRYLSHLFFTCRSTHPVRCTITFPNREGRRASFFFFFEFRSTEGGFRENIIYVKNPPPAFYIYF